MWTFGDVMQGNLPRVIFAKAKMTYGDFNAALDSACKDDAPCRYLQLKGRNE